MLVKRINDAPHCLLPSGALIIFRQCFDLLSLHELTLLVTNLNGVFMLSKSSCCFELAEAGKCGLHVQFLFHALVETNPHF